MAIVFACEALRPALDEALPMLATHQALVAPYGSRPLDPDHETWDAADELGLLRVFTARLSGVLVGLAVFQVGRHPNFHARYASQHALCLEPAHRRGRVGYEFVKFIDGMLRQDGCAFVYHETMS